MRKRAPELRSPAFRQSKSPLATVGAMALPDPTLPAHDLQRARKSCTVHRQKPTQPALGYLAGQRKHLQDGELCSPQPGWTQRAFVGLRERPSRAAKTGTGAGK